MDGGATPINRRRRARAMQTTHATLGVGAAAQPWYELTSETARSTTLEASTGFFKPEEQ
jgi:hypothetical protein